MRMDDAVQIIKPVPDSHYRLVPCKCSSDNVAYVLGTDGRWRVHCFDCGHTGPGDIVRHEAQVKWNGGGTMKHGKNPTREQKKLLRLRKLDPAMWLVVKDTPEKMELVHRHFDHVTKTIPKGGRDHGDL